MLRAGEQLDGRYRIDERIGQGGMGVVFRATDLTEERIVALKVLLLPEDESTLRFRREFRVMSRLQHPNVVRVVGFGTAEAGAYLAMDYVGGGTLTRAFAEPPADDTRLAARLDLLAAVADALAYVHAEGVIHRDLKPENVLLQDGRPVLMDFGLAKAAGGETVALTQAGDVLGTAPYMSPEQIRGHDVDHRSDLYALGCLIHWAATGDPPFTGETFTDVVIKHLTTPASPPSAFVRFAPADLDALVLRLLEKQAADRFASASDVATRLRRIASDLRGEELPVDPEDVVLDEDAPPDATSEGYVTRWQKGTRDTTPANLLRPPLIGRDGVWATLCEALSPEGEMTPVLVETDVGMGSTRLLDDLATEAASRDARVVRVRAEKGVDVAYEGWNRALERLWKREPAAFAQAADGIEDALALLLPEAFPNAVPLSLPADVAQLRLYEAVDRFLSRLLERGRLVLLLDDLHDADEGTVLLVRHLARGAVRAGAVMVASVQTSGLPRSTRDALRHLEARRVDLGPLDPDATGELVRGFLGGDVDSQLLEHVVRRSGGNPYFAHELLQALLSGGHISRRAESWVWSRAVPDLPASIEGVFDQRIEALDDRPRAVACAAATIGASFAFELLEELLGADEDDLLDDLDELVRAGIVAEQRGDRYAFVHPLLRDILHGALSSRRRRRFHAKLAEMLEESGDATPDVLAQHFAEAEKPAEAARYALDAARAAERVFANDVAERFYRLVLEVHEDEDGHEDGDEDGDGARDPEPDVVAEARLALARLLDLIGRWDEAEALFEAACAAESTRLEGLRFYARHLRRRGRLEDGEATARAALEADDGDVATWRELGALLILRSDFEGARTALHTALGGLIENEAAAPRELALTYAELGYLEFRVDAFDAALEWYQSAASVLDAIDDPILAARVEQLSGLVNYTRGRLQEAEGFFQRAYEGFQGAGDVSQALTSHYNLGMVLEERGALDEAAAIFEEIRERAYRYGDARNEASAAATYGWLLQRQGRFDEAVDNLQHAFSYFAGQGFDSIRNQVHLNLVATLARAGRGDEAEEAWRDYLARRGEASTKPYERALEQLTEGEVLLRTGQASAATEILEATAVAFDELAMAQECVEARVLLAEAQLASGRADGAAATLAAVEDAADALADPAWRAKRRFLEALAEGRTEDLDELATDMAELQLQSYERWFRLAAETGRR